jgi:hypothetical protein
MNLVVVSYYLDPLRLVKLIRFFARILRIRINKCIVVDNKNLGESVQDSIFKVVNGSNLVMDFSAWREGIAELENFVSEPKHVVLLNDTFFLSHPYAHMFRFFKKSIGFFEDIELPLISGELHPYRSAILTNPTTGNESYISSFAFALNGEAIKFYKKTYDDNAFDFSDVRFEEFLRLHTTEKFFSCNIAGRNFTDSHRSQKMLAIKFEAYLSGQIFENGLIFPTNATSREKFYTAVGNVIAKLTKQLIWLLCAAK